ncbi:hydantoinase/oxoprolinase family protein [Bradyrhizobium sp. RDT10]
MAERLGALGLPRKLLMIQSNGGAISIDEIGHAPVNLVLSGPAAGVGSLKFFGKDTGSDHLISIEVGGTSCDVTLIQNGEVSMTDQIVLDGYHLNIPAVDIHTVGAGGGTIASVDGAGLLKAGPEGAGSAPGPACYGRGGERPTVTDAQLVLGRLKPGPYAGGAITLDLDKAIRAIEAHVARPLGLNLDDAAAGIIQLVEQNILHAVEQASLEKGYNPRTFTLVAAGGGRPLHGPSTARLLGSPSLYIPRLAGVFCAFGMCNSDLRHDQMHSWLQDLDGKSVSTFDELERAFEQLQADAREVLAREDSKAIGRLCGALMICGTLANNGRLRLNVPQQILQSYARPSRRSISVCLATCSSGGNRDRESPSRSNRQARGIRNRSSASSCHRSGAAFA